MIQTPNDCALLITAPINKADFLFDLRSPNKDFIKNWSRKQRLANDNDLTEEDLWEIYSVGVKDFVIKITEEIKSFGVKVVFNAQLQDLKQIISEKKIITLEAHWFSPKLEIEDFNDLSAFVKELFESDKIEARALRSALFDIENRSNSIQEKNKDLEKSLVSNLNRIFSKYNSKDYQPKPILIKSEDEERQKEIWIHLNRFFLEKNFPSAIKQKCKIEMFDALHFIDDLQNSIPLDFNGVIDLTVCNSELVGKFVKQLRPCQVITNRFVTDLKIRLILYKGAIKMLLSGECQSYIEAVFKLRRQVLDQIGE